MHSQPQQTFARMTDPEKPPDLVPADKNSLAQACRRLFLGNTEDSDLMVVELQTRLVVLTVLLLLKTVIASSFGPDRLLRRTASGVMFLLALAFLVPLLRCWWGCFGRKAVASQMSARPRAHDKRNH